MLHLKKGMHVWLKRGRVMVAVCVILIVPVSIQAACSSDQIKMIVDQYYKKHDKFSISNVPLNEFSQFLFDICRTPVSRLTDQDRPTNQYTIDRMTSIFPFSNQLMSTAKKVSTRWKWLLNQPELDSEKLIIPERFESPLLITTESEKKLLNFWAIYFQLPLEKLQWRPIPLRYKQTYKSDSTVFHSPNNRFIANIWPSVELSDIDPDHFSYIKQDLIAAYQYKTYFREWLNYIQDGLALKENMMSQIKALSDWPVGVTSDLIQFNPNSFQSLVFHAAMSDIQTLFQMPLLDLSNAPIVGMIDSQGFKKKIQAFLPSTNMRTITKKDVRERRLYAHVMQASSVWQNTTLSLQKFNPKITSIKSYEQAKRKWRRLVLQYADTINDVLQPIVGEEWIGPIFKERLVAKNKIINQAYVKWIRTETKQTIQSFDQSFATRLALFDQPLVLDQIQNKLDAIYPAKLKNEDALQSLWSICMKVVKTVQNQNAFLEAYPPFKTALLKELLIHDAYLTDSHYEILQMNIEYFDKQDARFIAIKRRLLHYQRQLVKWRENYPELDRLWGRMSVTQ